MSPQYRFKSISSDGKEHSGKLEADSDRAAREKLKDKGLYPVEIVETGTQIRKIESLEIFKRKKVSTMHLAVATRQLTTLVGAGLPLVDSLKALTDQLDHDGLREAFIEVRERVNEGLTLHAAMNQHPNIFPSLYVIMVRGGEASGTLDEVLNRLADMLEAQAVLQRKVISAISYPILMLFLCFGVLLLLLTYVVPQISEIFKERGKELPLITEVIVVTSEFLLVYWLPLSVLLVFVILGLFKYKKTPRGTALYDKFVVTNPLFGPLLLKLATARLATNLGTMLKSGIDLLGALKESKQILGNTYLESTIEEASEGVEQGRSLAAILDQSKKFPKMFIHMLAIGERSGSLDDMLIRTGKSFETEVEAIIGSLTSLLEPLLIVFLAFVVGGVLAAVMLPMLEVTSIGGG